MSEPIRQTSAMEPCEGILANGQVCGSVYRRGDCCNMCGHYQPERSIPGEKSPFAAGAGKEPRGKVWNSKQHRYVRAGEVQVS